MAARKIATPQSALSPHHWPVRLLRSTAGMLLQERDATRRIYWPDGKPVPKTHLIRTRPTTATVRARDRRGCTKRGRPPVETSPDILIRLDRLDETEPKLVSENCVVFHARGMLNSPHAPFNRLLRFWRCVLSARCVIRRTYRVVFGWLSVVILSKEDRCIELGDCASWLRSSPIQRWGHPVIRAVVARSFRR